MTAPSDRPHSLRVAVIGGGAGGVLAALAFQREGAACEVLVIDPAPGRGVAYGGADERHLLNTRAGAMSVDPDRPADFLDWLNATSAGGKAWKGEDFAPRRAFGDYLESRFRAATANAFSPARVRPVLVRATAIARRGTDWIVALEGGERVSADVVLLATGNQRPRPLAFAGREDISGVVIDDPWDEVALEAASSEDVVLLVGSGLTAVDALLSLTRAGDGPRVLAVSRRGLTPKTHGQPHPSAPPLTTPYPTRLAELHALVRRAADAAGDNHRRHGVFLALRQVVAEIWQAQPLAERRRFLRHLRPFWEVERHRLAPEIAAVVSKARHDGRFDQHRGRIVAARPVPGGALVRLAGLDGPRDLTVSRIVNCTGPDQDVRRADNPVLASVLGLGAQPDSLGLGFAVNADANLLDQSGSPIPGLYALGSLTRGTFFEITAMPDIRAQASRIAKALADRHAPRRSRRAA